MAVALGPGRFYGSSLPRPRFFPGGDRVDPPTPVNDALLSWAHEAHWSMGGLGVKRLRLQGRIEGSIDRLRRRAGRDARAKARAAGQKPASLAALGSDDDASDRDSDDEEEEVAAQELILKREVVVDDDEDDSDESEEEDGDDEDEPLATIATAAKKKRARKLGDEFDRVAAVEKKKQKPAPVRTRNAAAEASAPVPAAPASTSTKRKASAAAAGSLARSSPRRKAAALVTAPSKLTGARRTSPRNKH